MDAPISFFAKKAVPAVYIKGSTGKGISTNVIMNDNASWMLLLWVGYTVCASVGWVTSNDDDYGWKLALMVASMSILPLACLRYYIFKEGGKHIVIVKSIWVTLTVVVLLLYGVAVYQEPMHSESPHAMKIGIALYIVAVVVPHYQAFSHAPDDEDKEFKGTHFVSFVTISSFLVLALALGLLVADMSAWTVATFVVYFIAFILTSLYYKLKRYQLVGTLGVAFYVGAFVLLGVYTGHDAGRADSPMALEAVLLCTVVCLTLLIVGTHVWGDAFGGRPRISMFNIKSLVF